MCGSVGNSFRFILIKYFGSLRQIDYKDVFARKTDELNETHTIWI